MNDVETLTPDEALELVRKLAAALADLANAVAAALEPVAKVIIKILRALRPYTCLWRNETKRDQRIWVHWLVGDMNPPRSWAEAKRIWRRHGRLG